MTNSTEVSTVSKAVENPTITVEGFKLKKLSIISTFSDTAKIDKAVDKFTKDALSVVPDLTNKKGRDAIASVAFKISKKKTSIVSQMIDPSIEEAKALVKNVNAGKKYFQTKMDNLRDEVRAPLNEWEAAEKIREEKRISDIRLRIEGIDAISFYDPAHPPGKTSIASLMEAVDSINCEEGFAEFTQDALQAKSRVKEKLTEMLNVIIQKEIQDKADEEFATKELELKEQQLKAAAQERVNKLMMIPVGFFGKDSHEIRKKITSLENYEVKESEFGELTEQAKTSVTTVVDQLSGMLQQQQLVEQASIDAEQAKEYKTELEGAVDHLASIGNKEPECSDNAVVHEEKPVEQKLADRFAPDASQSIPEQNRTHSRTVTTQLTPHQAMIKDVNFWAGEYGIVNSEYSDLMNILNKYK